MRTVSGSDRKWNLSQEEDIIKKSFQSKVEFDRPVGLVLILDRQREVPPAESSLLTYSPATQLLLTKLANLVELKTWETSQDIRRLVPFCPTSPDWSLFRYRPQVSIFLHQDVLSIFTCSINRQIKNIATGEMSQAITNQGHQGHQWSHQ